MSSAKIILLLPLAPIFVLGAAAAQDMGARDTVWIESVDWEIDCQSDSFDLSPEIGLWAWTDDSLLAASLPYWVQIDTSSVNTEAWGFTSFCREFGSESWEYCRHVTSIDSLIFVDTFLFGAAILPTEFQLFRRSSIDTSCLEADPLGYNGFCVWQIDFDGEAIPLETKTKLGSIVLKINLERDRVMPRVFDILLDTAFFPPASRVSFHPTRTVTDTAALSYTPETIMGVVHVTASPPKDADEVTENIRVPALYELSQNFPNPFNLTTTISYRIDAADFVTISIYNIMGREVETLVSAYMDAGRHQAVWDGTDASGSEVANGIYFYRMCAGDFAETRKMLLLK
jgi:hypothetical protein